MTGSAYAAAAVDVAKKWRPQQPRQRQRGRRQQHLSTTEQVSAIDREPRQPLTFPVFPGGRVPLAVKTSVDLQQVAHLRLVLLLGLLCRYHRPSSNSWQQLLSADASSFARV